jgi:hypothetical protein
MASSKRPRQLTLFDPAKKTGTDIEAARIILAMGETRYTGAGSLMTRWAGVVLRRARIQP